MAKYAFLDNGGEVKLFAHRGGDLAGAEKENTMAAFESAVAAGYNYLETDVICSSDGVVMAIHGSKNPAEAEATGLPERSHLETKTRAEIQAVKIGGEPIPTLQEVLTMFPDTRVNIDAKTKAVVRPLGGLVARLGAVDRVCIAAFDARRTKGVAEEIRERTGRQVCTATGVFGTLGIKLPVIGGRLQGQAACLQLPNQVQDLATGSNLYYVTERLVERAHDQGREVHVWTPNQPDQIAHALSAGVDGVISDDLITLQSVARAHRGDNINLFL